MSDEWAIPAASVPERKLPVCPDCYQKHGQIVQLLMTFTPAPDAAYYLPDGTRVCWADPGERMYCMRCWWSCLRSEVQPDLLEGWPDAIE
jgi:hypothetical protein